MRTRMIVVLGFLLPWTTWDLGRGQDRRDTSEVVRSSLKDRYLGALVELFDQDGKYVGGRLWAVTQDSMYLLRRGEVIAVPQRSLLRITLTQEDVGSASDLIGPIGLGAYAGVCLFGFADRSTYLDPGLGPGGALLGAVLGAAAVGTVAALAPESEESVTILSTDIEEHEKNWSSFRAKLAGSSRERFHFSVRAAFPLKRSVYHTYASSDPWYGNGIKGVNFMLLRSVHADYAVNDAFSVGLAYIDFRELGMFASRYDPQTAVYESAHSTYETGHAILLIGCGHPYKDRLPKRVFWEVGGGIGRADILYEQMTYMQSGFSPPVQSVQSVNGSAAAIVLFTELKYQLTRTFLIGFSADAVHVPGRFQDAVPAFAVKRRPMGNYSWGFSMGFLL